MPSKKLVILTCMRSYSSLISAMIGQHSGLYTVPEINPFVRETVDQMVATFKLLRPRSLDGLYRLIAELEFGGQSYDTILAARAWVDERGKWNPAALMEYVSFKIAPRIVVEKSPSTVVVNGALELAVQYCPDAYYLHLYRNPIATTASIAKITNFGKAKGRQALLSKDPEVSWYNANRDIIEIAQRLPSGQFMSVRGEDVLRDPDTFLTQICTWLGLEVTDDDLEAMRHPERSPYSCFGPLNAPFGADPNFLEHPEFSQRPIPELRLDTPLAWDSEDRRLREETVALSLQLGYGTAAVEQNT